MKEYTEQQKRNMLENTKLLNKIGGLISVGDGFSPVIFNFLGRQYSTNFNRKKEYSLKSYTWKPVRFTVFDKVAWILQRRVKILKRRK